MIVSLFFVALNVNTIRGVHRSTSELDINRYNDISPTNQEKNVEDKKKRGRSPFKFV